MAGESYDALFIGAGHNGLTCACYLAAAGLRVGMVERRAVVGGAAVTEEFHPGFRNSTASYTVSLLNPRVVRDLRLAEHGLKVVLRPFANFLPLDDSDAPTSRGPPGFIKVGGKINRRDRFVDLISAMIGPGSTAWTLATVPNSTGPGGQSTTAVIARYFL